MYSVGIDIGSFSLKLAVVESSSQGARLIRFEEYNLNQDPASDQTVEIIDILRRITSAFSPDETRFILCLKDRKVSIRNLSFPFKEKHKIVKSLPFELEDAIPMDADETVFDARFSYYQGINTQILACASPKKAVLEILDLSRDIGVFPHSVTVQSLAYANLFLNWNQPLPDIPPIPENSDSSALDPEPARLLLDIGHKACLIVVVKKHCLVAARTIDWGIQEIAQILSTKYNMHYLEAVKEVQKKGFILLQGKDATKEQIRLSKTIKDQVDNLAHSLKLSLLELCNEHHIDITEILLVGGGSQIKNMGAYLTQKLEIAANQIDLHTLQPKIEMSLPDHQKHIALSAICLAVEGLRKPKNPAVNLLKDDLAPESQVIKTFISKWGHTAAVAGTAYLFIWIFVLFRGGVAEEMADQSRQLFKRQAKAIAKLKGPKASPRNVKKFLKEIEKYKKNEDLNNDIHKLNSSVSILKKISQALPSKRKIDLNIESLNIKNEKIKIRGRAKSKAQISLLKESLKSISANGKVQSNHRPQSQRQFSFQFTMKRKGT